MPGIVAPTSAVVGHESSTNKNTTALFSPISHLSRSDTHNVSKRKQHGPNLTPGGAQKNSKLKLGKPLSKKARRIITEKTTKLIKRRNTLDREVLAAVEKKTPDVSDWLPRDKLLRNRERLERQEQHHLRKCTKKLDELKKLYLRDPSSARAYDYDLARTLFWRFKRNLGPLLDEYTNRPSEGNNDSDETSPSGSDSDSDLSDTPDDEDEELRLNVITAKSPSNHGQKTAKKADRHSQNTTITEDYTRETPANIQANRGKRNCEGELPEATPSKKVRFTLDGNIDDLKSSQQNRNKERKTKKGKKEKHAPVQEAQINDK
ncbi:hypothetical protein E0Z10_g6210 [Xylaria hypoxylon]|uniref:rRNA-processing protein EFG1 n=1 Tax=Xylaria hypoxylon TaxID=37992 RepID=A0A4Z0YGN0_9PEZI|nr:hypothetical protein E0Z10_g6210 [Xylaria hypoxylon]